MLMSRTDPIPLGILRAHAQGQMVWPKRFFPAQFLVEILGCYLQGVRSLLGAHALHQYCKDSIVGPLVQ